MIITKKESKQGMYETVMKQFNATAISYIIAISRIETAYNQRGIFP